MPQVVRGFMAMVRTSGGSMTMKLEPETLGSLRVNMRMHQGQVRVQMLAESAEARALLTQHADSLRQSLESQGLKVEQISVQPMNRHAEGQADHSPDQPSNRPSARHDAGGQQSRGRREREPERREASADTSPRAPFQMP